MVFCIVVDRLLLESPLTDAPQIYRYTLLIRELGTEIVALTLHYRFYCATIVADSAIEYYEICLPHTYILYSFALFFYPLLLLLNLDSHSQYLNTFSENQPNQHHNKPGQRTGGQKKQERSLCRSVLQPADRGRTQEKSVRP